MSNMFHYTTKDVMVTHQVCKGTHMKGFLVQYRRSCASDVYGYICRHHIRLTVCLTYMTVDWSVWWHTLTVYWCTFNTCAVRQVGVAEVLVTTARACSYGPSTAKCSPKLLGILSQTLGERAGIGRFFALRTCRRARVGWLLHMNNEFYGCLGSGK